MDRAALIRNRRQAERTERRQEQEQAIQQAAEAAADAEKGVAEEQRLAAKRAAASERQRNARANRNAEEERGEQAAEEEKRAAANERRRLARERQKASRDQTCQFCGVHGHNPYSIKSCPNCCSYCDLVGHATSVCPRRAEEEKRRRCINKDAADYKVCSKNSHASHTFDSQSVYI